MPRDVHHGLPDGLNREAGLRFDIVTIFPGMVEAVLREGVLGRAIEREVLRVGLHDLPGLQRRPASQRR